MDKKTILRIFYMKELGKPGLFFHDLLWAYRGAIPWSAHGSYIKITNSNSIPGKPGFYIGF